MIGEPRTFVAQVLDICRAPIVRTWTCREWDTGSTDRTMVPSVTPLEAIVVQAKRIAWGLSMPSGTKACTELADVVFRMVGHDNPSAAIDLATGEPPVIDELDFGWWCTSRRRPAQWLGKVCADAVFHSFDVGQPILQLAWGFSSRTCG